MNLIHNESNINYVGSLYIKRLVNLYDIDEEKKFRIAYLKYKKNTKWLFNDDSLFATINKDNIAQYIIDRLTVSYSSEYTKYIELPYENFVYKRAVKLVFDNNCRYVVPSDDENIFGICIDIDEENNLAIVNPITEPFEGYLMASYDMKIQTGDFLDFNNNGEVVISSNEYLPTCIKMKAVSNNYIIDLRTEHERVDLDFMPHQDFSINYVKVNLCGIF